MNAIKEIRRAKARELAQSIGGISHFAKRLGKQQSQMSHVMGKNPIKGMGDLIARQIENAFDKPLGWLDDPSDLLSDAAEAAKDEMATQAFCTRVPLIDWTDLRNAHQNNSMGFRNAHRWVRVTTAVSEWAFALRVQDDTMESARGLSIFEGSLILVEPDAVVGEGSLVVVTPRQTGGATLKQWVMDAGTRYLKPFNRRYPILRYTPEAQVHGVVKQMWYEWGDDLKRWF